MLFQDRQDAGRQLAEALNALALTEGLIIGLLRGGVVVAAEAAKRLHLPLDCICPRKIGAPFNSELAIGAIAGNEILLNDDLIAGYSIDAQYIERQIALEKKEASRRLALYRSGRPAQNFKGQTIIVIDDGIATGATMRVSLRYLFHERAKRIIAAIPVAPPETIDKIKQEGFETVCLYTPHSFTAVGQFYKNFPQTEDEEVIRLLENLWT